MPYKTILVYLPGPDMAELLLKNAVPIANKFNAHLICLHVIPDLELYQPVGMYLDPKTVEAQVSALRREADETENVVKNWTEPDSSKIEWRCLTARDGTAIDYIVDQSLFADLIITEQRIPLDILDSHAELPVQIALQSGRPVLAIPKECTFEGVADRALVAWDASRSASRAAFEAVPLLQDAKDVTLYSVPSRKLDNELSAAEFMTLSLSRHDIRAETAMGARNGKSVGEAILNQAAQTDSDLLVMGCYGHSRFRETVFGGVTRHILHNAKIPLFLAH